MAFSVHSGMRRIAAAAIGAGLVMAVAAPTAAMAAVRTSVPTGFKANSITFSNDRGWILGNAPCADSTCTYVIGTADGGRSWHRVGSTRVHIAESGEPNKPGIEEIRFETDTTGWLFTPFLLHTVDGGRTWKRVVIPGGDRQVLSLATGPEGAFAVTSSCAWATGLCNHQPLHLWRTSRPGSTKWDPIPLKLPANVIGPNVSVWGSTVYVVDPQVDVTGGKDKFYASVDGGTTFRARPVPCEKDPDVALFQAVPSSANDVALLCDGQPGGFRAKKDVYRSTDTGKHDTFAGELEPFGVQAQLAVSTSGNLAVASYSDGSFLDTNTSKTGTQWNRRIASGDGGAGWNDLTWTGNSTAWVVGAPVELPADIGKILVTHDSWRSWHFVKL